MITRALLLIIFPGALEPTAFLVLLLFWVSGWLRHDLQAEQPILGLPIRGEESPAWKKPVQRMIPAIVFQHRFATGYKIREQPSAWFFMIGMGCFECVCLNCYLQFRL